MKMKTRLNKKCYSELKRLETFEERFEYLKTSGVVGQSTFGYDRYLNQVLYKSAKWRKVRNQVIIRDNGCDLGMEDYPIFDKVIVHHMNPITIEDVEDDNEDIYNPDYLICVSELTHNAIHYGNSNTLPKLPTERTPGDTCPWKN